MSEYNKLIESMKRCYSGRCTEDCPHMNQFNISATEDGRYMTCEESLIKDAGDAIKRLTNVKDELIQRICQHCDTTPEEKLKDGCCEECPIVGEIKAVFDEQPT